VAASLAKLDWGFQDIVRYLRKGEYRKGLSSGQKSAIRSAIKAFCYEEKKLYYTGQKSGRKRLVVMNEEDKRSILQRVHGADHCGQTRTRKLLEEHYYWKGMVNDIRDYINACEICKQKSYKRSSISHVKLLKASYPWEVLGMDLLGPFPATSRAHRFVLLIVDYFTKWAELTPMTDQSAAHVVAALTTAFHRFGFPKKLFCNVSEEYVAQINEEMFRHFPMCSGLAISHLWANGAHRGTSQALRDCVSKATGRHRDWELQLEQRLFEYHTSKHSATRYSPFYLMLGREARLPE
uniref:Gypsy retrotransposon integrase-like protein 1 n=1 Tax=Petromyzon marinus TaxID=7757 RepID=S4RWZ6_PETMA